MLSHNKENKYFKLSSFNSIELFFGENINLLNDYRKSIKQTHQNRGFIFLECFLIILESTYAQKLHYITILDFLNLYFL